MTTKNERVPRLIFQPAAGRGLLRGIDRLAGAIRPTLGPRPGIVAVEQALRRGASPELLDSGGVIARRVIQLPDRSADMGAMLLRGLLYRLEERVGDGTATATVIFRSVYRAGLHYLAAGGDRMLLRRYLEEGLQAALAALAAQARPVAGRAALLQVARSACPDPALAELLGEIFDLIGEHGCLELREGQRRDLAREYVTGTYWAGGPLAKEMIAGQPNQSQDPTGLGTAGRAELPEAAVLATDLDVNDPAQLLPVLRAVLDAGRSNLLLVASSLSANAVALLMGNRPRIFCVAVAPPGTNYDQKNAFLGDLAALTGGQPLLQAAGETLAGFRPTCLGRARRAWADRDHFGVITGQGDPLALRERVAALQAAYRQVQDADVRRDLRTRIGKLQGGAAVLWTGGLTEAQVSARKAQVERAAEALRGALAEGVVPGGGAALLACCGPLRTRLAAAREPEERAACRILLRAVEEPARAIACNAGADVAEVLAAARAAGPGYAYDVESGRVVDMAAAGIVDSAAAQREALAGAVTTAGLALTVSVLVQRRKPEEAARPE